MRLFNSKQSLGGLANFEYLDKESTYLDSACQTLRPAQVTDAMLEYFQKYNACGGRVKYDWGTQVDEQVRETKKQILSLLRKKSSEYVVAFTLNTSYGINLVLGQLPLNKWDKVITSEIEHNSVFLPTIEASKRLNVPRYVLGRTDAGALQYQKSDLKKAIVVLNSVSNIDGRSLSNLNELTEALHETGGIILIDAAQGVAHDIKRLQTSNYDVLFFSGHKFYGPSLGIIVIKRSLLETLEIRFVGGGTVEDVEEKTYQLVSTAENISDRLEIGLQDFAGIIGLGAAIKWHESYKPEGVEKEKHQAFLSKVLFEGLTKMPSIRIINSGPSSIVSFYSEKIDAHRLAIFLSSQNIMVRSGYFCCHYYLKNLKKYPPLVRVSLGLNNTQEQVEFFVKTLKTIIINS